MSTIPRPHAILFDLDGTLVDTAPDLVGAMNELLLELGQRAVPESRLRPEASNGSRGLLRAALNLHPGHPDYRTRQQRFLALYQARLAQTSCAFPGIDQLLGALSARGLPWGVVTNKPGYLARPLLAQLGLAPAVLLGGDAAARPKPAPDSLFLACAHLRLAPGNCWYLGDARRDIDAAVNAGLYPVAVAYGYLDDPGEVNGWPARSVIQQPLDLLHLIDQSTAHS